VTFAELWIEAKDDQVSDAGNRVQSTSEINNLSELRKSVLTSSKLRFQATFLEKLDKDGTLKFKVKREAGDFVVWEANWCTKPVQHLFQMEVRP
jgi:hypothetical protein